MPAIKNEDTAEVIRKCAIYDITAQNALCSQLFTPEQKSLASQIEDFAYPIWRAPVYVTFRKTCISISVAKPLNHKPVASEIKQLDEWAAERGVKVIPGSAEKARLYRIFR